MTDAKLATGGVTAPAAGAQVLIVKPEVQLSMLTATGIEDPRADWSATATDKLNLAIAAELASRSHKFQPLDADLVTDGRAGQLLRLNSAVGSSIMAHSYGPLKLPTKKSFDWTLGEGAKAIAGETGADYALFINARGSYASAGRVATMVGMSLLGVSVPLGQQQVSASLVELSTGRVVWYNFAIAGPNADMREDAGAAALTKALLKTVPL